MQMVAIGDFNMLYVVAIIILAIVAYSLWRNSRRHGRAVEGAGIGPAVDAVLRSLLAGETRFVVLSVSARVYLQFAVEPNGGFLAEANCPPGNEVAEKVLSTAGLGGVPGQPNYRGRFDNADAGRIAGLVRSFLEAIGAQSITIRTGR